MKLRAHAERRKLLWHSQIFLDGAEKWKHLRQLRAERPVERETSPPRSLSRAERPAEQETSPLRHLPRAERPVEPGINKRCFLSAPGRSASSRPECNM